MRKFGPTTDQIAEHNAEKAQWFAAKMGLIYLCAECHGEIFLQTPKPVGFIHDCAMPRWMHIDGHYQNGRWPCFNDESDGVATPMSEGDFQDLHDQITRDDWWYEEND